MSLHFGELGRLIVSLEPPSQNNDHDAFVIGNQRLLFVRTAISEGCSVIPEKRTMTDIREEHRKLDWTVQFLAMRSEVTSFGHANNPNANSAEISSCTALMTSVYSP